jgi:hypothetical protein
MLQLVNKVYSSICRNKEGIEASNKDKNSSSADIQQKRQKQAADRKLKLLNSVLQHCKLNTKILQTVANRQH